MSDLDTPKIVTLIGGGGFIGRYACEALLKEDVRLRIAERNPKSAHTLQPLSKIGQIALVPANVTNEASMKRAIEGSDAVVYLVGTFDTDKSHALHVEGAERAARLASETGASAFVMISALGADADGDSVYARSKANGEDAVRREFPNATILRPSTVFGSEDEFTNRFAGMMDLPVTPVLAPETKMQPVFVRDLAQAIARAALHPTEHGGTTYEIAGPAAISMRDINAAIADLSGLKSNFVELPHAVGGMIAAFGFLPFAPLTKDQWALLQKDNVATGTQPGLQAMGIAPTPMRTVAGDWLSRYRPGGRFARAKSDISRRETHQ